MKGERERDKKRKQWSDEQKISSNYGPMDKNPCWRMQLGYE